MKAFRYLLFVSFLLTSLSSCSDSEDNISINDIDSVIEDEFSEYRELIGKWEGGWYDLGMALSADKKCSVYRGEPHLLRQGTWEYDPDSQTITTTCGYIFNVEVCTPTRLTCSDQYGEYHSFSNVDTIDHLSVGNSETNRRVIIGTWKHTELMTTLKFYKDGQFALFYGDTSYIGKYYWSNTEKICIDCGLFEPDDIECSLDRFSGMFLRLTHGYANNPTLAESMIVGDYSLF